MLVWQEYGRIKVYSLREGAFVQELYDEVVSAMYHLDALDDEAKESAERGFRNSLVYSYDRAAKYMIDLVSNHVGIGSHESFEVFEVAPLMKGKSR